MHINPVFKKLIDIDKSRIEYKDFVDALLAIDWQGPLVSPAIAALNYSPGLRFRNIPWINSHPGFKKLIGIEKEISDETFNKVQDTAVPFFNYIESCLPGHKIIKAEMMATQPEMVNKHSELARMHHDWRIYHKYSKRCQLGILTNPGSFLFVEGQELLVPNDCLYEFDNRLCHWGVNWGETLKLVFIVDIIELSVWDKLPQYTKDRFFEEEITEDALRSKQYTIKFKNKYRLV